MGHRGASAHKAALARPELVELAGSMVVLVSRVCPAPRTSGLRVVRGSQGQLVSLAVLAQMAAKA